MIIILCILNKNITYPYSINQIIRDPMKTLNEFLMISVLLLSFLAAIGPLSAAPAEVWVDGSFTGAADGWGTIRFNDIQEGINNVAEGGTVHVAAGTYALSESLTISKNISLIGDGQSTTILEGDETSRVLYLVGLDMRTQTTGYATIVDGFTITKGHGQHGGGGMLIENSSPTVTNCTFSDNNAVESGGGMYNVDSSSPTVTNCILWNDTANSGTEICNENDSTPSVTCSDIQGGYAGTGNINADPLFVNAAAGDLGLGPDSPCRNAGIDASPAAYGTVLTDIIGTPRPVGYNYDMGAYESSYSPPVTDVATDPIRAGNNASFAFSATVSDSGTGDSAIMAAEYFIGDDPGMGNATPLSIDVPAVTVDVSAAGIPSPAQIGTYTLSVRGCDAQGNWGTADTATLNVVPCPAVDGVSCPNESYPSDTLTVTASVSTTRPGDANVASAVCVIDGVHHYQMDATDGAFDSFFENVTVTIPLKGYDYGQHTVIVKGTDDFGIVGSSDTETFCVCVHSAPVSQCMAMLGHAIGTVNMGWDSVLEGLPAVLEEDEIVLVEQIQNDIEKAAALSNPVLALGRLNSALDAMNELMELA